MKRMFSSLLLSTLVFSAGVVHAADPHDTRTLSGVVVTADASYDEHTLCMGDTATCMASNAAFVCNLERSNFDECIGKAAKFVVKGDPKQPEANGVWKVAVWKNHQKTGEVVVLSAANFALPVAIGGTDVSFTLKTGDAKTSAHNVELSVEDGQNAASMTAPAFASRETRWYAWSGDQQLALTRLD